MWNSRGGSGVGQIDLDGPLPDITGDRPGALRLLVRLHTAPLGEVVLAVPPEGVAADQLGARIWDELSEQIAGHLAADGSRWTLGRLPVQGLRQQSLPTCLSARANPHQPSVTVVIATRNRCTSLQRTLESLAHQAFTSFDVVVVDSAPSDDSTRTLLLQTTWPFPLRYVRTPRPGLAVAHNTALPHLTSEITAFTDDDVQVDQHWLAAVAEGFAMPDVTCVTGLILPAELETQAQQLVEQASGFAKGFEKRRFSLAEPNDSHLFPFAAGQYGSGANMSFRTAWLKTSGGFDDATGAGTSARGGDDLAAFLSVVLDGGVILYHPGAIVRHWHRREYSGLRRQAFGYGMGLGAYLASTVYHHPRTVLPMLARVPAGASHYLRRDSLKNHGRLSDFPAELTWRERLGLLCGPGGYVLSRWRARGGRPPTWQEFAG